MRLADFGNDNKTSIVGYIDKEALSYKSLYEQLRLEQFMYVQITRHRRSSDKDFGIPFILLDMKHTEKRLFLSIISIIHIFCYSEKQLFQLLLSPMSIKVLIIRDLSKQ